MMKLLLPLLLLVPLLGCQQSRITSSASLAAPAVAQLERAASTRPTRPEPPGNPDAGANVAGAPTPFAAGGLIAMYLLTRRLRRLRRQIRRQGDYGNSIP